MLLRFFEFVALRISMYMSMHMSLQRAQQNAFVVADAAAVSVALLPSSWRGVQLLVNNVCQHTNASGLYHRQRS
jgi:hypothetical protein